jgi:hypothetical protein
MPITMSRRILSLTITAVVGAIVFSLAFVAAPRSCDGGLTLYFWAGVVSLLGLMVLPFLTAIGRTKAARIAWSIGFAGYGVAIWLTGLLVANIRVLCRLF